MIQKCLFTEERKNTLTSQKYLKDNSWKYYSIKIRKINSVERFLFGMSLVVNLQVVFYSRKNFDRYLQKKKYCVSFDLKKKLIKRNTWFCSSIWTEWHSSYASLQLPPSNRDVFPLNKNQVGFFICFSF